MLKSKNIIITVRLLCYSYMVFYENFTTCSKQTVLLECIKNGIKYNLDYLQWLFYWSILIIHYNFQQMLNIAININITISYYA